MFLESPLVPPSKFFHEASIIFELEDSSSCNYTNLSIISLSLTAIEFLSLQMLELESYQTTNHLEKSMCSSAEFLDSVPTCASGHFNVPIYKMRKMLLSYLM